MLGDNIAIVKAQAERRWEDLGTVLTRSLLFLVCGLLAATTCGCSAKVEVGSVNRTSPASVSSQSQVSTGEKARTTVEVDLLQSRPSTEGSGKREWREDLAPSGSSISCGVLMGRCTPTILEE